MKIVHDLLDRGFKIPYVNIKKIDVRSTKLLQARINADVHRFCVIALIIDFVSHIRVTELEVAAILKRGESLAKKGMA